MKGSHLCDSLRILGFREICIHFWLWGCRYFSSPIHFSLLNSWNFNYFKFMRPKILTLAKVGLRIIKFICLRLLQVPAAHTGWSGLGRWILWRNWLPAYSHKLCHENAAERKQSKRATKENRMVKNLTTYITSWKWNAPDQLGNEW